MVGADLLCGSAWVPALWFNLCNLGMVVTLWLLLSRLPRLHQRMRTPTAWSACSPLVPPVPW